MYRGCSRFRLQNATARLVTGNAGAPLATLAAGTPERRLQGCDARSSVAVWHFVIVPIPNDRRLVADVRERRLRSTLLPNMRCDVDTYCALIRNRGFAAAGHGLWTPSSSI